MEYRRAVLKDTEQIYMLVQNTIQKIYPKHYPKEVVGFFCELHARGNLIKDTEAGLVSILEDNGTIVGTGSHKGNHITRVYVTPACQGRGYGSYIMKCLENQIGLEHDTVYLDASLPAIPFYKKRGYRTIKQERLNVKNGATLTYDVMSKPLIK